MANPDAASTANASKAAAFERVLVAKGTDSAGTQLVGAGAGDMLFVATTHGSFAVGDYISGTSIRRNTRVTHIDTSNSYVYVSRPLTGVVSGTVTILESREAAADGPPAFELKAGSNVTISSSSQNAVGASILEIAASSGTTTTINNNDDDRVITGSGTANTLNAETDLTFGSGQLKVNYDTTSTAGVSIIPRLFIDIDKSGVTGDTNTHTMVGAQIDMDDAADNHTGSTTNMSGLIIDLESAYNAGTVTNTGLDISVSGGDNNYAAILRDGYVGIGTATPAHILDITGPSSAVPSMRLKSVSTSAGPTMIFEHDGGATAQADDQIATIKFLGESADDSQIEYGRIGVKASAVTSGSEGGKIEFFVPKTSNGAISSLDPQMSITSGSSVLTSTVNVAGNLTIDGNLTVSGDTITANVGTLDVEDQNITLNKSSGDSSSTADGAGITIQDAVDSSTDASLLWTASTDRFGFSHGLDVAGSLTAETSLTLDAVEITTAEIQVLDGVTAGQVTASRALVVDSSRDLDDSTASNQINNLSISGTLTSPLLNVDSVAYIDTASETAQTIATTGKTIATFPFGTYRTVKFVGHIIDDTTHHTDAFEVLVTYKGDSAPSAIGDTAMTTYAYLHTDTSPMGTLSVALSDPGSSGSDTNIDLVYSAGTQFTGSYAVTATQLIKT